MAVSKAFGFGLVFLCLMATVSQGRRTPCSRRRFPGWRRTDIKRGNRGGSVATPRPTGPVDTKQKLKERSRTAEILDDFNSASKCRRQCRKYTTGCRIYRWIKETKTCIISSTISPETRMAQKRDKTVKKRPVLPTKETTLSAMGPASAIKRTTAAAPHTLPTKKESVHTIG